MCEGGSRDAAAIATLVVHIPPLPEGGCGRRGSGRGGMWTARVAMVKILKGVSEGW